MRSQACRQGFPDFAPYCAAKFGVLAVTQDTARGLIQHGITVNASAPGVVDTPMWNGLNEDIRASHDAPADSNPTVEFAGGTLQGPPAAPEELAPFLVHPASPESDYMTGQMHMVDGGLVLVGCAGTATTVPRDRTRHPGASRIALLVDDIKAKEAELEAKGIEFFSEFNGVDEGVLAGWLWVYFSDPDGYLLELVEVTCSTAEERAAAIADYLAKRT